MGRFDVNNPGSGSIWDAPEDYYNFGGPNALTGTPPAGPNDPVDDNGNGDENETDYSSAWWSQPYSGGAFKAPGGSGGGGGGGAAIEEVGAFEYDPLQYTSGLAAETYTADPFTQSYDYGGYTPAVDPYGEFVSPVDAVQFREFAAPTAQEAQVDPGYQFRVAEGERALQNAAAAKGMLRTGNTWKDLMQYGQNMASSEYDKVYGRRRGEHDLAYQQALQANRDIYGRAMGEHQLGIAQNQDAYNRGMQSWQMNRQNELDAYDRALQAHQYNQQAQTGAQQLSEASRLGLHQADYGVATGLWDRNVGLAQTTQDYALAREAQRRSAAESAAARARAASDQAYNRARSEYDLGYSQWLTDDDRRWDRNRQQVEWGLRALGT